MRDWQVTLRFTRWPSQWLPAPGNPTTRRDISVIGPALRDVPDIDEVFIFGSWAARYLGVPGPEPADVDVMIVGTPSRRLVGRALRPLSDLLGREVNETIVSGERWRESREVFVRTVKRGPLVPVALAGPAPERPGGRLPSSEKGGR
jgi:predicted nucleotidyltransferase